MNLSYPSEITTRNDIARDIIAGFAAVTPSLAGAWRLIDTALADLPIVLADLGRAQAELEAVRLDNLAAEGEAGSTVLIEVVKVAMFVVPIALILIGALVLTGRFTVLSGYLSFLNRFAL